MADAVAIGADASGWLARMRQRAFRHAPSDHTAVVLRHSRIYLLPTRRGWAVIGTLLLMLLASLNYALALGMAVTFLLAGLVAAAQLHTFRNLAGIEITPLAAGETFAGGNLEFALALHAGAAARTGIIVHSANARAGGDIAAGQALTISLAVDAPKRGRVALGRVTLTTMHPFGLWRGWAYVHFLLTGIVFPAAEIGAPPLPRGHGGTDPAALGRSDNADLAGLREFQRGDPPQRVAWKAVARGAGWYSKEFDGAGGGGPVTLAWSDLPPTLPVEERLSRLTAWVLAAERAACPFALQLPGMQLASRQGRDHRREALTALAEYPEDGSA
ncbi:MAG: DUF58 domain-containing protein [Burkholderiales bacterium]|nr:DUF58 domain-containing protein [Burkholderiales bacterium]